MATGAAIRIGSSFRASGVSLCAAKNITIGDRVTMGANASVVDTDFHSLDAAMRSSKEDFNNAKHAQVTIEDDVFVGMNALILKGATIGRAAIIGAGSVVAKDVQPNTIVPGNPAREIDSTWKTNAPS